VPDRPKRQQRLRVRLREANSLGGGAADNREEACNMMQLTRAFVLTLLAPVLLLAVAALIIAKAASDIDAAIQTAAERSSPW